MHKLIINQFELARGWTINVSESISKEIVNLKLPAFNNTIHWQIGHILTTTEYFLFDIPNNENHLPANYWELFGSGSKPDDRQGDMPSVDQLIIQLKEQLVRMRKIDSTLYDQPLAKPIHRFETLADCAAFSVLHEVLHVGKMEEMERVIIQSLENH